MSDIVERLRDHATDWNGAQMPDLEPAKGDPTAGMLREAAAEITRLRAENEALKDRLGLKGAGCACRFEDDGETQTTWCAVHARLRADLAAAQEREQRMREALEKIAEHLPSFDYVGRDEYGIRLDFPGSPYDRGKADASKHLSGIARAALGEP